MSDALCVAEGQRETVGEAVGDAVPASESVIVDDAEPQLEIEGDAVPLKVRRGVSERLPVPE